MPIRQVLVGLSSFRALTRRKRGHVTVNDVTWPEVTASDTEVTGSDPEVTSFDRKSLEMAVEGL